MRKIYPLSFLLIIILFAGCFKDDCKSIHRIYKPVFKTLTQVRAGIASEAAQPVKVAGKIYLYKNYIFLNEPGAGIHVIDNSDPSNPKNISFINIPGNYDLAIKGNYLYADSYSDLVVLNIADPKHAVSKTFKNNVFPRQSYYYYYTSTVNPDSVLVPVDYIMTDTLVNCDTYNSWIAYDYVATPNSSQVFTTAVPSKGIGGSTARFTVLNDYLYTVDYYALHSFDITNASDPEPIHDEAITVTGGVVETIYPSNNNLFIGTSNGIFIYSVAGGGIPTYTGQFGHFTACDPVIADNSNAFVTLRSGTACQGFNNELEILDIATDITNPSLIKTYSLTNPRGLTKDGNLLFICDGADGLKLYNAADINNLSLLKTIGGFEANDVIAWNKIALVTAGDGLYQYDYSNTNNVKLLSKISINQK
ncbi:LVIVD repeat-containing protein [Parafilimonas terrae]|uniref:Uncharacterized conserved protein n=1 Tax=Parafilimonas terrae TaxID=1465490 RepID=A0A1I5SBZ0_9BACT|nr:hypothetical protein [Parafilimonas terrae]SFP67836.1 Uncharacterized conserved protein [Parafilimonas terrae]